MYCIECGFKHAGDPKFCANCGVPIGAGIARIKPKTSELAKSLHQLSPSKKQRESLGRNATKATAVGGRVMRGLWKFYVIVMLSSWASYHLMVTYFNNWNEQKVFSLIAWPIVFVALPRIGYLFFRWLFKTAFGSNSKEIKAGYPVSKTSSTPDQKSFSQIRRETRPQHKAVEEVKQEVPAEKSKMTVALGIGIIILPWFFAWVTLHKGFPLGDRVTAFLWFMVYTYIFFGLSK